MLPNQSFNENMTSTTSIIAAGHSLNPKNISLAFQHWGRNQLMVADGAK